MKQYATPVLVAILITALVVGGASYFWSEQKISRFKNPIADMQQPTGHFPVNYLREGLLSQKEKNDIEEKFTKPFVACENKYNPSNPLVALVIEVPENVGQEFKYIAVAKFFGGIESTFGKRGENFPPYYCSPIQR